MAIVSTTFVSLNIIHFKLNFMKLSNLLLSLVCVFIYANATNAQLVCRASLFVDLGTNCQIILTPEDIGLKLDPSYNYTLSRSEFDCYDVGHSFNIILEQRDRNTNELINSCFSNVTITSRAVPNPCERPLPYCYSNITVYLNAEGYVILTPEMISVLPIPSTPYQVFSVSPNVLDCGNIGNNSVRMIITSACFPEDYCIMNVMVRDTHPFRPTCFIIDTDGMRFFPANLDQVPVLPGSIISYLSHLRFSYNGQINGAAEFRLLLSRDKVPDPNDLLVSKQVINLKTKTTLSGKFILPNNLSPGTYYLIGDLFSKNPKIRFSFKTVIQRIQIGKGGNIKELEERSESILESQHVLQIYPNPFNDNLNIIQSGTGGEISKIEMYNIIGVRITNLDISQSSFDMSQLQSGTYLIRVEYQDGRQAVQKIVKQP